MRFENASPRTWLLATTAAWALVCLVLALFGMGGRIAKLPDDAGLVRALPVLPKAAPERLGPLTQYSEIANRPLFADDRQPHPFSLQPQGEEQAKSFDYVLTSVMITPTFKMAIIQAPDNSSPPLRIKLGEAADALPSWRLQSLDPRSAVFIGPEGERRLELRVFNGVGGEAPTAVTKTDATPRPQGLPAPPGQASPSNPDTAGPQPSPVIAPAPAPAPSNAANASPATPNRAEPNQPMTEQAQMEAIRKRIEARRAQLRQEALQQQQKPPVK
ncbi:type II secretion system protein XpsN [Lysobacter terrae]